VTRPHLIALREIGEAYAAMRDAERRKYVPPRQYAPPTRPSSKRKAALLEKSLRREAHP